MRFKSMAKINVMEKKNSSLSPASMNYTKSKF